MFRLHRIVLLTLTLLLAAVSCRVNSLYLADGYAGYRAEVGLKLFRSLLHSDLQISQKTNANDQLPILIIYLNQDDAASDYQKSLLALLPKVAGKPTLVQTSSLTDFLQNPNPVAGIFLAQQLNADEIQAVINKGIREHFVVFSPFEGDVEQGVLAGISVQASVKPYINSRTLKKSGLQIKDFYLKAARQYE